MCVIMVCSDSRPTEQMIDKAWAQNDDGVGLAWREEDEKGDPEVVWAKGLMDLKEAKDYIEAAPLPFVVHFRTASIGGIRPILTHPFEVSEEASIALDGRTKGFVLFHNGHWKDWDVFARQAAVTNRMKIPVGRWSDSRAMAWLCHIYGLGFMELLPEQRGVAFGPKKGDLDIFTGPGWTKINNIWCSNDHFLHRSGPGYGTTSTSHSEHGYTGVGRVYPRTMCRHQQCTAGGPFDADGYCAKHPGGKEAPTVAELEQKGTGGSSNVTPFPQLPKGTIIKLDVARDLHKQKDSKGNRLISKQMMKSIQKYYDKMKSPKEQKRTTARKQLETLTQKLCERGLVH